MAPLIKVPKRNVKESPKNLKEIFSTFFLMIYFQAPQNTLPILSVVTFAISVLRKWQGNFTIKG